ncbi:MAG: DNA repair protein RecN [Parasporobacterium sp.]|nr:DNA repair protein RecN [Parasporobacterium sp.]
MLNNVHLKNLALIEEADIDFTKGLNIMTGETGAGKSIIIGSINIALGDKASRSFIRSGADSGLVELRFSGYGPEISGLLSEMDIPEDEGYITVTRKLTRDGSISRINGTNVTLTTLRSVTSLLVDVHGQHDHQSLLNPARHIDITDEFAGREIADIRNEFHENYILYKNLRTRLKKLGDNPAELEKEAAFLRFEYKEIEDAGLKPDEDVALEAEYKRLSLAEKTSSGLQKVRSFLCSDTDGITARISDALKEMNYLAATDSEIKSLCSSLMDLDSVARDFSRELSHFADSRTFDAERYAAVHNRLNDINRLKSKYGSTVSEILKYQDSLAARLEEISSSDKERTELRSQMEQVRSQVNRLACALSDARKAAASRLENVVTGHLKDLNFLNADFRISFTKADKIYENGFDKVEFLISANPGEPVKPLANVASGGELSRVMLAIKAAIAGADHTDTLIFDEIDTGISGRTAQKVAEKLAFLSSDHQLICITHLPQIAAMADTHFCIEKAVTEGSTISGIRKLTEDESAEELARLISGSEITETSLSSAKEMKAAAHR